MFDQQRTKTASFTPPGTYLDHQVIRPGADPTQTDVDTQVLKKAIWKLDIRIVPVIVLVFVCSFLDRTNIGNAKILGFEKDVGITNRQFELGLMAFYVTYIICEVPSNLVIKKITPRKWLTGLVFSWGIIVLGTGFIRGPASFIAMRALLGLAEGGLLPGVVLYLSTMYSRRKLAVRIGVIYSASSLSGAFGGFLARGLSAIGTKGGLEGWRWIMIVEGLLTVVVAAVTFILLPNSIQTTSFLSGEEVTAVQSHIMATNSIVSPAHVNTSSQQPTETEDEFIEDTTFQMSEVIRGLTSLSVWLTALAYFCILVGMASFSIFLPTILLEMGISKDPSKVQLWTVIPYTVGAVTVLSTALISERTHLCGVLMLVNIPFAMIGYGVLSSGAVTGGASFAMTCLIALGLYGSVPCILAWNSNNSAGYYKRASSGAMQLTVANMSGFVAAFSYPAAHAPRFRQDHARILGLLCAAWVLILANVCYCVKHNRDKAKGKYERFRGSGDDRDPRFKMTL